MPMVLPVKQDFTLLVIAQDSAYKQIIIAMGSGATAALGSFDYLMRKE